MFTCLSWLGFEDAANALCVSGRMLRKCAEGKVSNVPFPFEEQRGRMVTQTGPAYTWLLRYTKCPHLKKPADFDEWQATNQKSLPIQTHVGMSLNYAGGTPETDPYFYELNCRLYNAVNHFFETMPESEALKSLRSYIAIELDTWKMLNLVSSSIELKRRYPDIFESTPEKAAAVIGVELDDLRKHLLNKEAASERGYGANLPAMLDPGCAIYDYFQDKSGDATDPDFSLPEDVATGLAPVPSRKDRNDKKEGLAIIRGILQMRLSFWEPNDGLVAVQRYIDRELKDRSDVTMV